MKRILAAAALAALLIAPFARAGTVGGYPNASSPLNGTERILADQTAGSYPCVACTVNITPLQLSNYTAAQAGSFGLLFNNSGAIGGLAPVATGQYCLDWASLTAAPTLVTCTGGGSTAFSALTTGTNTTATMTVGTGASILASGTGSITATAAPLSGLTGLGTGVSTALAVNTGSSGAFVVNGGALGTPSSGVATNLTGTASALNIGGTAANITATSNSTLTTLSALSLPSSQVTGLGTFATQNYATPPAIGGTTPAAGSFTTLSATGQITSTLATGTAPFSVASTTQVANLNAASVGGYTLPCTVPTLVSGDYLTNNGATCSWAAVSASGVTLQTNGTNNLSQTTLNIENGQGIAITNPSGGNVQISTNAPTRTVTTSPTVASTDMGGAIFMNVTGGGTLTIPAISSTVFAAGESLVVVNYSTSTATVSTTPTINSGGGCISGTGIPAGYTWNLLSNGTTLDCIQTVPSSASAGVSSFTGDGTLLSNSASTGAVTATLASAGADTLWGNVSGTSGAPGYHAINPTALAVLQDTTAITVSGCAPAATELSPTTGGQITQPATACTTVTFTFAVTAPHGWNCTMGDITKTAAGTFIPTWIESSNTTTSCTVPIPAAAQVASDVLSMRSSWY